MKKILSFLTAVTMISGSVIGTMAFAEDSSRMMGDVNGDGIINYIDSAIVLNHYATRSSVGGYDYEEACKLLEKGPNNFSYTAADGNEIKINLGSISRELADDTELYGDMDGDGIATVSDAAIIWKMCMGDVNYDGIIDASDASMILAAYADISSGLSCDVNANVADVNNDGYVDASDASYVLSQYADMSSGKTE